MASKELKAVPVSGTMPRINTSTIPIGVKTSIAQTVFEVIKWLKDPASDSALYKMWGNGIALPCAAFVMEGIANHQTERIDADA